MLSGGYLSSMQIAIITGPSVEIAKSRIIQANRRMDGVELRLDLFRQFDREIVSELLSTCKGKSIVTLRSRLNGGGFVGFESKRQALLLEILELKPDYVDIEYNTDQAFIAELSKQFPKTNIISSYHNFDRTPRNIELILDKMVSSYASAYAYKICCTANSLSDSFKMLRFIQQTKERNLRFIGLCMGESGKITREKGPDAGNYLNYIVLHQRDSRAQRPHFT